MDLAQRGRVVERPIDVMKSPVILDFLDLPDREVLRESDLESAILNKLSQFLLELGKGFAFVARQKRLTFEHEEFYVDLVQSDAPRIWLLPRALSWLNPTG
jgi:predicted nuclease of restriction endonuclease-like (RecB) superfamily